MLGALETLGILTPRSLSSLKSPALGPDPVDTTSGVDSGTVASCASRDMRRPVDGRCSTMVADDWCGPAETLGGCEPVDCAD